MTNLASATGKLVHGRNGNSLNTVCKPLGHMGVRQQRFRPTEAPITCAACCKRMNIEVPAKAAQKAAAKKAPKLTFEERMARIEAMAAAEKAAYEAEHGEGSADEVWLEI